MKILHTADWHIGSFRGPEENGVNLRSEDTIRCLDELVRVSRQERPELVLVAGDIFHKAEVWQGRSHREVLQARKIILELAEVAQKVIVMRGTPNHDSAEAFEELSAHFAFVENVDIVTTPQVIEWDDFCIAVLPGFDRGVFRAKFPGLSKEDENQAFTEEISNIVLGLRAQCSTTKKSVLMTHYTVPGCNAESGQTMMLTQFEPVIPQETLIAANFDLVALGHIHRPQKIGNHDWFYSGAMNAMNFNDEGQPRGFWIHYFEDGAFNSKGLVFTDSQFFQTPIREFITFHLTDTDIMAINQGHIDDVAMSLWRCDGSAAGKIVRVHYSCSYENNKAFNKALLERALLDDGAFMVWEILPEKIGASADRNDMSGTTDPEQNLWRYLEDKQYPEERIQELVLKARPIIAEAEASLSMTAAAGAFTPVEIEVKNYRNYAEEKFNFEDIQFCTINGANGAGKSSLFMDAIIDCIYEEPREGELTGWIRNDEKARSGAIMFTFRLGEKLYRVTRTRARSGKGTLNLVELVDGEWTDRSREKYKDTQTEIINVLGMDSLTFKSCALIMQDQYGLFLEAKKEDRMVILSTLLGLGIYQAMEKIASDRARISGAKTRDLKQEAGIYAETIRGYGDPEEEISRKSETLQSLREQAEEQAAERDAQKLELMRMRETQERCEKLEETIVSICRRSTQISSTMKAQAIIMQECTDKLTGERMIAEKANRYRLLDGRRRELSGAAAVYDSKFADVARLENNVRALTEDLENQKEVLLGEQKKLAQQEDTSGDEEAIAKAKEYAERKADLDRLQSVALAYHDADRKVQATLAARNEAQAALVNLSDNFSITRSYFGKKIGLLSDCGCIDIDNADCRFLQDAKSAQAELLEETAQYEAKKKDLENILADRIIDATAADEERAAINYDPDEKAALEKTCASLLPYVELAEQARERSGKIAFLKASLSNMQSNISAAEERLATAKSEADRARSELENCRSGHDEYMRAEQEMHALEEWVEKEKELPVIKEKLANAEQRISELRQLYRDAEKDLDDRQKELIAEREKLSDIAEKRHMVARLEGELAEKERRIDGLQMELGALRQKAEQVKKLKAEINDLQEKAAESAKQTADYDILKSAFSQDGIPHQVVRTIIPQLTATANTILGQMTGGRMGIEFRTEKTLKSNSQKEVVTLDIFIEEYGRATLPYLSKSGGEKVKASLSVILALAEIKSLSAGVQMGMLFIDEPPFLDGDGIQAYCDALETIQNRYKNIKIMAITHDPTMKARFPQNIDVVKTDHGSKVIY